MRNAVRVAATAIFSLFVFALIFPAANFAQNGPPPDRPGQGDLHRADPCVNAPDAHGEANGIEKRCALGGSAGVARGDFNDDGIADLAVGVPDETRQSTQFDPVAFRLIVTDHSDAGAVDIIYGSSTGLTTAGNQILDQGLFNVQDNVHYGRALAAGKFRGAGFASDLAVAAPGTLHNGRKVGAINVHFSASGRLNRNPNQTFFADQFSGAGTVLGAGVIFTFPDTVSMTWADFNGDAVGDLAVELGILGNSNGRSAVLVMYGTAGSGLSASNSTVLVVDDGLSENNTNPPGGCADTFGGFGRFCATSKGHVTVAGGDIDGDGKDELLIGAPSCNAIRDDGSKAGSGFEGCVAVVPGKTGTLSQFFGWNALLPEHDVDEHSGFGLALAVGDFDADGRKDVAVGAPNSLFQLPSNAGMVRVFTDVPVGSGGQQGVTFPSDVFNQNTPGIETAEANDRFGSALAANDFNGDGFKDLAIGVPGEGTGSAARNGEVNVIFGSASGLSTTASTGHPAAKTLTGGGITGAAFGSSLSAWNFGRTAEADLAVGVPFDNLQFIDSTGHLTIISGAGTVRVFYGSTLSSVLGSGNQFLSQAPEEGCTNCLADRAAAGNHFGAAVY